MKCAHRILKLAFVFMISATFDVSGTHFIEIIKAQNPDNSVAGFPVETTTKQSIWQFWLNSPIMQPKKKKPLPVVNDTVLWSLIQQPMAPLPYGVFAEGVVVPKRTNCSHNPPFTPMVCRGREKNTTCVCYFDFQRTLHRKLLKKTRELCYMQYPELAYYPDVEQAFLVTVLSIRRNLSLNDDQQDFEIYKIFQRYTMTPIANVHIIGKACVTGRPDVMEYQVLRSSHPRSESMVGPYVALDTHEYEEDWRRLKEQKEVKVIKIRVSRGAEWEKIVNEYESLWKLKDDIDLEIINYNALLKYTFANSESPKLFSISILNLIFLIVALFLL